MINKRNWLLVIGLLLTLALAACAGGSENEGGTEQASGTGNETSEGGDLVLAVKSDATTLDPAGSNDVPSGNVQHNIFNTLVERDADNNIVPSLAESWEAIDETTYEFKLRQDVKFHDGETFNAEAVKVNLDRILDPKVASSKYNTFEMISNVEVVDDYTVRITTEYPFSPILAHLSHGGGRMVSPKSIAEDYEQMKNGREAGSVISQNPIGTGYFKFESWTPGTEIKLVRNDDYWGQKVHVDTVTFKVVPESATRQADLERGFVHIIDPVSPNEVATLNNSDFATVIQTPSTALTHIGFNTTKAPFDDVRVRQAVSMLINKQEIIDGIYDGFAIPAEGPLAPNSFGYAEDLKGIEYDVEGAKALLKEAGYEDGFKIALWTNDNPERVDIAVYLQDLLKDLQIEVDIQQMELGAYLQNLRAGDHDMYMLSWGNSLADGDNGLYNLFHSSMAGAPPNAMNYGSPEVDELLQRGRQATDLEDRKEIYKEAQELLVDEAPMIFLNYPEYLTGVSNNITGFAVDSANTYLLQDVKFVK